MEFTRNTNWAGWCWWTVCCLTLMQ